MTVQEYLDATDIGGLLSAVDTPMLRAGVVCSSADQEEGGKEDQNLLPRLHCKLRRHRDGEGRQSGKA